MNYRLPLPNYQPPCRTDMFIRICLNVIMIPLLEFNTFDRRRRSNSEPAFSISNSDSQLEENKRLKNTFEKLPKPTLKNNTKNSHTQLMKHKCETCPQHMAEKPCAKTKR
jgi:hypothetical protein